MPPAATCCLPQATRQHSRRRLIRHGSRRFPTPFCSTGTAESSTEFWSAWTSLNCGGQFWPTSPRITSASTNTGWPVPPRGRRRVAADKTVRGIPETQLSILEEQSLSSQFRSSREMGSQGLRPGLPSPAGRAFGGLNEEIFAIAARCDFSFLRMDARAWQGGRNSENSMEKAAWTAPIEPGRPEKQDRHRRRLLAGRSRRWIRRRNIFTDLPGRLRPVAHQERGPQIRDGICEPVRHVPADGRRARGSGASAYDRSSQERRTLQLAVGLSGRRR